MEPPPTSAPPHHHRRPMSARTRPTLPSLETPRHPRARPSGSRHRRQVSCCCLAHDISCTPSSLPNPWPPPTLRVDRLQSRSVPCSCTFWMPRTMFAFQSTHASFSLAPHTTLHGTVSAILRAPRPAHASPSMPGPRPKYTAPGLKTMSARPLQQAHDLRDHTTRLSLQHRLGAPPAVPNGFQPRSTVDLDHPGL
jgi:hypothetical protein